MCVQEQIINSIILKMVGFLILNVAITTNMKVYVFFSTNIHKENTKFLIMDHSCWDYGVK